MLKRTRVFLLAIILLCGIALSPAASVGTITLAWDASPDLSVVGYTLYYGIVISIVPSSSSITGNNSVITSIVTSPTNVVITVTTTTPNGTSILAITTDRLNATTVGNATITTLGNLLAGTNYFFFVTAYNAQLLESEPSNIITDTPLPANTAPSLSPIFSRTIAISTQLIFYAAAADPDTEQTLAYSLDLGAPAGASINPVTGQFTWTPAPNQGGMTYSITIRVTDNGTPALSNTAIFSVTVTAPAGTVTPPAGPSNFHIFLPASP